MELLKFLSDQADIYEGLEYVDDCERFIDETERTIVEALQLWGEFRRPTDWVDVADFFELNLNLWSFEEIMFDMHQEDGIFWYYLGKVRI